MLEVSNSLLYEWILWLFTHNSVSHTKHVNVNRSVQNQGDV